MEQDLDPTVLQALTARMGERGPVVLARLLDTWETETAARLVELSEAVDAGDPQAVARVAHSIRGGSASLGAHGLAQACRQVEARIREGGPVDLSQAQQQIAHAVGPARAGLAQLRVGSGG